jgi:electron transport complex protein RnfE
MSFGFTFALLLISFVREVLGVGTITLFPMGSFDGVIEVPVLVDSPARVFALAAGALLVMGYLIAGFRWAQEKAGGEK